MGHIWQPHWLKLQNQYLRLEELNNIMVQTAEKEHELSAFHAHSLCIAYFHVFEIVCFVLLRVFEFLVSSPPLHPLLKS